MYFFKKFMLEVTIFILLTMYVVALKEIPHREFLFSIWLMHFILCSINLNSYTFTFKSMDQQIQDMHYKIKNHNVTCSDMEDIASLIKEAINDTDYGFTLGSNDDNHVVIEIKKL